MRTKKIYCQYILVQLFGGSYYNEIACRRCHGIIKHYVSGNNNVRRIRFVHEACTDNEEYYRHLCYSKIGARHIYHKSGLHNRSTHMYCTKI